MATDVVILKAASKTIAILGGLLIYVGLEFLIDWLWKARDELPLSDYVVVILILIVIIFSDILQGVTFGFLSLLFCSWLTTRS